MAGIMVLQPAAFTSAGGALTGTPAYLPIVLLPDLPTPTVAPANIQITHIEYDPPGDDVQGEYVLIENLGGHYATMTGWTLCDAVDNCYTVSFFILSVGSQVRVWTKSGAWDDSNLYWGRDQAVWNNDGDTATLRNGGGIVIDTYGY
jgi:hypothetical protein